MIVRAFDFLIIKKIKSKKGSLEIPVKEKV